MKWYILLAMGVFATGVLADVKFQSIFGNNMVLQRNTSTNFWGTASPGEQVTVTGSWGQSATVITGKNGEWKLKLKTPKAGGPFTIIMQGNNRRVLHNVMSGEVWLCTGQSNMDSCMGRFRDTREVIAKSNFANIRFFDVRKKTSNVPLKTLGGNWQVCTPETTRRFSATGYFFGLELYKKLNIPIGLIECTRGGSCIESWTPWEKQRNNSRLIKERKQAGEQIKTYNEANENEKYRLGKARQGKARYEELKRAWFKGGKKGKEPRRVYFLKHPLNRINYSSNLYNGMLHPLVPFSIKGVIWYQGESNANRTGEYAKQLEIMITAWRELWNQGNFPFYSVQLPRFWKVWTTPVEEKANWALMREAFAMVTQTVPNTGMAITIDTGEANDVHPQEKSKVGDRLARLALSRDYGRNDVVRCGPVMKSCRFKTGKAIVKFETYGSALAVRNGEKLNGFALCTDSGKFVSAEGVIVGCNTVEVTAAQVDKPTLVYYAWGNNPKGVNLINQAGLPASPFRFGKKPSKR